METLINVLVFGLLVVPLLTLLHELGHAAPALLFTDKPVTVVLGRREAVERPGALRFQLGRLRYVIMPGRGYGFCLHHAPDSRLKSALISSGGPLASFGVMLLAWGLDSSFQPELGIFHALPYWIGMGAFAQFVITALPMRYPFWMGPYAGTTSDGLKIYHLLTAHPLIRR
jgi:hypothetical protein